MSSRADLGVFLTRALRLDDAAVVRLRNRSDTQLTVWVNTGLDVLATRTVEAQVTPNEVIAAADHLLQGLRNTRTGLIDTGYSLDSAWRGALPPETGYSHVDDIPAAALADLANRGAEVAREHSTPQGMPGSLLDQEVMTVSGDAGTVTVPMRAVFALTGMGFIPKQADAEMVRVRMRGGWVRIDARFGSVVLNRTKMPLFVR
ncbi:hypothetical protein ONR57_09245 [Hoyosella sp. YIM 151337]|uniref:hypothetical protein n=1 Tax=Hoyosella sp. YIM 151337 TaxID=2992742 RepID=UPI0022361EA8|nr:hypothetical protein [Hoyosella sp. YIM 151337]MCW4353480.1 hypothetical protein [Hoyosella sp. YIM 151337]